MIGRIWHGWTTPEKADSYENLLKTEIFPGIAAKKVDGYRGIQLLRRPADGEVEFITIMWFDSWEAVRQFTGEDYEQAYEAKKLLADPAKKHLNIAEIGFSVGFNSLSTFNAAFKNHAQMTPSLFRKQAVS